MNAKKIWILSSILGTILASIVYFGVMTDENKSTAPPSQQGGKQTDSGVTTTETQNTKAAKQKEQPSVLNIREGKRAVSISVNEVQGLSGFLKPNDMVDVVIMVPSPNGENASSQILLQNIRVLATGATTERTSAKQPAAYQTVTLEVSPHEGSSLVFASSKGAVTLMLRKKGDEKTVPHAHITLEQLNKGEIAP